MNSPPKCPSCGEPLPSEGWAGLCPKCLVRVSLEGGGEGGESAAQIQCSPDPNGTKGGGGAEPSPCAQVPAAATSRQSAVPPQPDVLLEQGGMMIGRYKLLQ